mmetsp:Transcript_80575/g.261038  ORF Transcript_80575/g.261038 Transcript_80575/m.261038 type:complete len:665 (+) Transcript_80575:158-2152(+)
MYASFEVDEAQSEDGNRNRRGEPSPRQRRSCNLQSAAIEGTLVGHDLRQRGATDTNHVADGGVARGARDLTRVVAERREAAGVAGVIVKEVHILGLHMDIALLGVPLHDAPRGLGLLGVRAAEDQGRGDLAWSAPPVVRQLAGPCERRAQELLLVVAARSARGDDAEVALAAEGFGHALAQRGKRQVALCEGRVLYAREDLVARALRARNALLPGQRPVHVEQAEASIRGRCRRCRGRRDGLLGGKRSLRRPRRSPRRSNLEVGDTGGVGLGNLQWLRRGGHGPLLRLTVLVADLQADVGAVRPGVLGVEAEATDGARDLPGAVQAPALVLTLAAHGRVDRRCHGGRILRLQAQILADVDVTTRAVVRPLLGRGLLLAQALPVVDRAAGLPGVNHVEALAIFAPDLCKRVIVGCGHPPVLAIVLAVALLHVHLGRAWLSIQALALFVDVEHALRVAQLPLGPVVPRAAEPQVRAVVVGVHAQAVHVPDVAAVRIILPGLAGGEALAQAGPQMRLGSGLQPGQAEAATRTVLDLAGERLADVPGAAAHQHSDGLDRWGTLQIHLLHMSVGTLQHQCRPYASHSQHGKGSRRQHCAHGGEEASRGPRRHRQQTLLEPESIGDSALVAAPAAEAAAHVAHGGKELVLLVRRAAHLRRRRRQQNHAAS